ncbi:MAG: hypothetical protein WAM79_09555 [Candidatus Sulfotelmatobacter sp.]
MLQSIAHASLSIDKTRALLWSKELFRTAHQLPLGQDRAAYQKNALITMARVNPLAAAALYKQQDNLRDWATDEIPSEDIRSDRTRTLFPALWSARGKKSLPQIRDIALWLGDTGGYPYSGLTPIFSDIAKEDRNAATDLFLDAITYLPRGQDIRSTNRIFTDFLLASWKLVPPTLAKKALATAVDAFNAASQDDRMPKFRAESAGGSSMAFSSQAELLLYKLLPVARELDPDLAHKIEEEHRQIADYPPAQQNLRTAGVISFPGATPAAERRALDQSRYYQAGQLAETDPGKAIAIAREIADPDVQQAALLEIAPFSARTDRAQADAWVENAAKHLDDMNASVSKLRVMVALANAYFVRGDQPSALAMTDHSLDLGEELYAQYMLANPGALSYSADGVDEMTELVKKAVSRAKNPLTVIERIEQVRQAVLKASLLATAAEAWSQGPNGRT